jgi:hypothetical protein
MTIMGPAGPYSALSYGLRRSKSTLSLEVMIANAPIICYDMDMGFPDNVWKLHNNGYNLTYLGEVWYFFHIFIINIASALS